MKTDNQIKQIFTKRATEFSIRVIHATDTLPKIRSSWVITDQLIRCSTSIGANISEAKSASSKKDYINFYTHALKSANETIYWINLLNELHLANVGEINYLLSEANELANILAASIITMKNKNRI